MEISQIPENEQARIEAMRRYQILDSADDPDFDGIVEIAATICNTPMAVVTLVDEKRQWFKARKGLTQRETHRDLSFCSHTILGDDILEITDTLLDSRFNDNPFVVGDPRIRFYAGMPLTTNDHFKVGTLAVMDVVPRSLNEEQKNCLRKLSSQVVNLLNMRYTLLNSRQSIQEVQKLAIILDQTSDAILAINPLGLIESWNYGAEMLYGYKRSETIGRSVHDIVRGSIIPYGQNFEDFLQGNRAYRGEARHLHKDGTAIHVLLTVSSMSLDGNANAGYVLQLRDISERHRQEEEFRKVHEEAMRAAHERYRNIFENSLHGIFQTTIEGQFITVNPALSSMFGYPSPEELIREVTDITRQLYVEPRVRQELRKLLEETGAVKGYEFRAMRRNRTIIWVRANIQLVFDAKGMVYFEGIVEDVTDRKISEEKLAGQFEELKKINYELDRFVYSVSHDLRAPLSSIMGIVNIAELESPVDTQKQYLHMIKESIHRLDEFIKAILSYSRNTRMDVHVEPVDFTAIVEDMKMNLQSVPGAEHLKLSFRVEGDNEFHSDSLRIGIIFSNLYSNAIKYQDVLKASCLLDIHVSLNLDNAIITFTDNGIGIPPELLDKVFDMFYRAHEISKGSGLGLYITRETVTKLRGSISVDSVQGRFTTIRVVLPNLLRSF